MCVRVCANEKVIMIYNIVKMNFSNHNNLASEFIFFKKKKILYFLLS